MSIQPEPQSARIVPSFKWVFCSPSRALVFGMGSGLLRPGPGTWGTLLAWLVWVAAWSRLDDLSVAFLLLIGFGWGCWACQRVGHELGRADDAGMVWDEMVAFWLVLWLTPPGFYAQLAAFLLFRLFDIVKPAPIRWFDVRLKNGFGVMWDDILAAVYTLLVLAVLIQIGVLP